MHFNTPMDFIRNWIRKRKLERNPSWVGAFAFPPGHFYSPLLDLAPLRADQKALPFDGEESWEQIDLRPLEQQHYFDDLLTNFPLLPFPHERSDAFRYFTGQDMFVVSDAFTLSGVIRKEKPRRIIEVGSGFSSAVMLDSLASAGTTAGLTFIEPYPDRLHGLLSPTDKETATIHAKPVQEIPVTIFDQLEAQDILFIDSSHVAKVGSDVAFLFLRVIPRLKPGVIVHVHDIFYPHSYPIEWIKEGRAWNESLFLRSFLAGNDRFQVMAFNPYAGLRFPELFASRFPEFLKNTGGSIWLRKTR